MAGDWLKFEKATPDKPEVFAIAAALGLDPDAVVGKLIRVWSWFDTHTVDGNGRGVTPPLLDRISGVPGFVTAMQSVGWIEFTEDGVSLPNFERHTGETAKGRALTAKRVAKHKAKGNAEGNDDNVTPPLPREEKRREEKKEQKHEPNGSSASAGAEAPDPIPSKAIVSIYNATMTGLAKVRELTPKRKTLIRTAWQASAQRRTREFWEAYFAECQEDEFLNGTGPYREPHTNWRPDFDYLLKTDTVTKVFERAMDRMERGE